MAAAPDGTVTVAVHGTDDAVWEKTATPAGAWSGWSSRGGHIIGSPALAKAGELYATGTDHAVWTPGDTGWASIGGATDLGPTATHDAGTPTGYVAIIGAKNLFYEKACIAAVCRTTGWSSAERGGPSPAGLERPGKGGRARTSDASRAIVVPDSAFDTGQARSAVVGFPTLGESAPTDRCAAASSGLVGKLIKQGGSS